MSYLIFNHRTTSYFGIVFTSREAAEMYVKRFGNPTWEVEEMANMSLDHVNAMSDR